MVQSPAVARLVAIVIATAALPTHTHAQAAPMGDAAFDSAYYAWQRGDYPDALRRLDRLMSGANATRYVEPAALLTGELYNTIEVTRDGLAPVWSADGRHIAWETGALAERVIHIAALDNGRVRELSTVNGTGARFDNSGRLLYVTLPRRTPAARDVATGRDVPINAPGLSVSSFVFRTGDNTVYALGVLNATQQVTPGGGRGGQIPNELYRLGSGTPEKVTTATGPKSNPVFLSGNRLLYTSGNQGFAIQDLATGAVQTYAGTGVAASKDGSTVAWVKQDEGMYVITVMTAAGTTDAARRREQITALSLSNDGRRITYQAMPREDWEVYVVDSDGKNDRRLTREIQHDLLPRFIDNDRIFAVMGEARHRRSYMYDVATGRRTRLFHNNLVRTVAPEYEWTLSPDGSKVLIVAERDGDTVSPERGIYIMDLSSRVTVDAVRQRVRTQLATELALREKGHQLFANIEAPVRAATSEVSKDRIYEYENALYQFDSKYITQPGNAKAIEYLTAKLREFGYEPELQWFETTPRGGNTPVRTANVIAKLPGTMQPDVLYTVSSHFDSVERGPGADDDTSGTVALLEAARVLAGKPQPSTIHFAFFTGEEAGLLGSREYVRRAVANQDKLVGALNNDMIGFANDQRLDNTIRYSNPGIRDIQHAAAFLFTDLITYDAVYYKSTDAAAYYDAYGDIVGGIGSYPILGNPHYHQSHDQLETMNHQLIAEVSKTTVATLMKLTNAPSRPKGLAITSRSGNNVEIRWEPLADAAMIRGGGYMVQVLGADGTRKSMEMVRASSPTTWRVQAAPGDMIEVWASGPNGLSWDGARVKVGG